MADTGTEPTSARVTLALGGVRSGKSRAALKLVEGDGSVAFLATARPTDEEMREKIAAHRAERPATWRTIEEPPGPGGAARGRDRGARGGGARLPHDLDRRAAPRPLPDRPHRPG